MFVDEIKIFVEAGRGGNGCLSFRREKYVPKGGPNGGNGGRGGDIFIIATEDAHTLVDFFYHPRFIASHGEHGKGKNQFGRDADPIHIKVPVGTVVWEGEKLLADMSKNGMIVLVAKGGRGGKGNASFTTSTQQAPRLIEKGEVGESKELRLELKLIADVGMVGLPNSGKSSLLSRLTNATPKIANYPFTTLEPQLGVVKMIAGPSFVLADIPGLIEGASSGKGLGIKFLKHLERTRLLIHLIDIFSISNYQNLLHSIQIINNELKSYSLKLGAIPQIVVFNKIDICNNRNQIYIWKDRISKKYAIPVFIISGATGEGIDKLLKHLLERFENLNLMIDENTVPQPTESVVFKPAKRFEIIHQNNVFEIYGSEIKKWVLMSDFSNRAANERFYKILKRMGVLKAMYKLGIKKGATVICEGKEFIFDPMEDRRKPNINETVQ
jgi:GTP-binding protein